MITYAICAAAPMQDNARDLLQTCRAPPELAHLPVVRAPRPAHARVLSTYREGVAKLEHLNDCSTALNRNPARRQTALKHKE